MERIRRITNLVVGKDRDGLNAELAVPVGQEFWDALDGYQIQFAPLPKSFESSVRLYRFDHGRGTIAEVPLWEKGDYQSDVHLSYLVEFIGEIPSITITNLRIP